MKVDTTAIILAAFLLFLGYAAIVIKREKRTAFKNKKSYKFGDLEFNTPAWWSIKEQQEKHLSFHRADTKYDWQATCELHDKQEDLRPFVLDKLQNEHILFDEEATDIVDKENCVRIEGTATKDNEQRLYLDIFAMRFNEKTYYFENRSSILNGCVEGPYFEDLVVSLEGDYIG